MMGWDRFSSSGLTFGLPPRGGRKRHILSSSADLVSLPYYQKPGGVHLSRGRDRPRANLDPALRSPDLSFLSFALSLEFPFFPFKPSLAFTNPRPPPPPPSFHSFSPRTREESKMAISPADTQPTSSIVNEKGEKDDGSGNVEEAGSYERREKGPTVMDSDQLSELGRIERTTTHRGLKSRHVSMIAMCVREAEGERSRRGKKKQS